MMINMVHDVILWLCRSVVVYSRLCFAEVEVEEDVEFVEVEVE